MTQTPPMASILVDQIEAKAGGFLATVTLNRPDKLNALNRDSWLALADVMKSLNEQTSLRCIILRGAGEKAFAAGADISAFEAERASVEQARSYGEAVQQAMASVSECCHPVIAMIQGVCVGGGLQLASACDMRIASHSARFGAPVKKLGLTMAYSELKLIADLVGPANALEILLEGELFKAERALEIGFINRLVADERLEQETQDTAERIADGAPIAARLHKRFVRRLLDPTPLTPHEQEESWLSIETEDYRTGVQAFLQKTKPLFKGA